MTNTPHIVVTGATSGLGREIAQQLAVKGTKVTATGRRRDRLDELARESGIIAHQLDLNSSKDIENFCAKLGPVDGLILNAGVTFAGDFSESDSVSDAALVQTNILANLQLIRSCLPALTISRGRILIVASLGGLTPVPYQAVYAGTKAFLVNFGLSLREEVSESGVRISVFAPGGIRTEMTDIPAMAHLDNQLAPAKEVARAALKAFDNMPALAVPGAQNKIVANLGKVLPRGFMARQAAKIYRGKG